MSKPLKINLIIISIAGLILAGSFYNSSILEVSAQYTPEQPSGCTASTYTWGPCVNNQQEAIYTKTPIGCTGGSSLLTPYMARACVATTYGVYADNTTGMLTGYAWSENIGWIKFGGLSGFPTGSGTVAQDAQLVSGKAIGWARACTGTLTGDCSTMANSADGWDGWISLGGNFVASAPAASPETLTPSAPRNVLATINNGAVHVWFWPPVSTGGSPITNYRIISNPGNIVVDTGNTYWDSSTYKTIPGLSNRVSYTFTVTATNTNGTSPSSEPSNALTLGLESNTTALYSGDWYTAMSTCSGLGTGWRLISLDDLKALNYENQSGAYWTSTEVPGDPTYVYAGNGREYGSVYKSWPYDRVWCVK